MGVKAPCPKMSSDRTRPAPNEGVVFGGPVSCSSLCRDALILTDPGETPLNRARGGGATGLGELCLQRVHNPLAKLSDAAVQH